MLFVGVILGESSASLGEAESPALEGGSVVCVACEILSGLHARLIVSDLTKAKRNLLLLLSPHLLGLPSKALTLALSRVPVRFDYLYTRK
jgi:hypothetical protein